MQKQDPETLVISGVPKWAMIVGVAPHDLLHKSSYKEQLDYSDTGQKAMQLCVHSRRLVGGDMPN